MRGPRNVVARLFYDGPEMLLLIDGLGSGPNRTEGFCVPVLTNSPKLRSWIVALGVLYSACALVFQKESCERASSYCHVASGQCHRELKSLTPRRHAADRNYVLSTVDRTQLHRIVHNNSIFHKDVKNLKVNDKGLLIAVS
jgi:hypothetical protein